jgi:hypothetical protein
MNGNLWVSVTAEAISTFRHLLRRSWSNFLARQAPGPDHSLSLPSHPRNAGVNRPLLTEQMAMGVYHLHRA